VRRTDAAAATGRRLAGGDTAAARRDHEHVVTICGVCDVAAVAVRQNGGRGKTRRARATRKKADRRQSTKCTVMTNRSALSCGGDGDSEAVGSDTRTRRRCCSDVSDGTVVVTARRRSLVHTTDERAMRAANDFVIRKHPAGRL